MTDLTETRLPRLSANTLPNLTLPTGFIPPDYAGGSIANIPSQVTAWLSAPPFGLGPLHPELSAPLGDGIRQVIVVLMDALGFQRFRPMLTESGSVWQRLTEAGVLAPITSIFPSTTAAATTSLATGVAPGTHNMLGFELWLKEYGVMANMISFSPINLRKRTEALSEAGFEPEKFVTLPTLTQHLLQHGMETHAFMPTAIMRSSLTRMQLKGARLHPYLTPPDLWHNVRQFLEASAHARQFVWIYWDTIDTLSHTYGPSAEPVEAEARRFGEALGRLCLDRLSPAARAGTVLVVMADHGQVDTPPRQTFELRQYSELLDALHMLPSGENRAAYLHCRPGAVEAARAFIKQRWPRQFHLVEQPDALAAGLYSPREAALDPRTPSRLGDLLVLARNDAYLWWAPIENWMLGRHGGLTADEMLAPFLAARLDKWLR